MKNYNNPTHFLRLSLGLTLLLTLGLPAVTFAQDMSSSSTTTTTSSTTMSATDKAMADYVKAAGEQLDAYRQQINVDPPLPRADAAGLAKDKLTKCEDLLTQLKQADAAHFDTIKGQFEVARNDLAQAVQAATRP